MDFKIVVDSCCDLPEELRRDAHFVSVPLTLTVGDTDIIDDETFDQADFLKKVKNCPNSPKSACPSPAVYMDAFTTEEPTDIYVVTLSAELSGSFASAEVGRNMYAEEGGTNQVHTFNSMSASSGEVLVAKKIQEAAGEGKVFAEVVESVEAYIKEMRTYFVIETLDTLRKNGRLTNLQAIMAGALSIKPIMSAEDGKIIKLGQTRGIDRALNKMIDIVNEHTKNQEEKELIIAHCNCSERAAAVKARIENLMHCKTVSVVETHGISSMYANEGGIIIAV